MPKPEYTLPARSFVPLPLGAVRPRGWLKDQLEIQRDGLAGHLEEIWPLVGPDSGWKGGKGESWEIGPYYLDGLVPLAYTLNDKNLIRKTTPWIEWALTNTGKDGWIGPPTDHEDKWWPRAVMLKVLTQYAEATGDPRVENVLAAYFMHMFKRLPDEPLAMWAKFRWGEYLPSLLWLCERRACPVFERLALILSEQGYDWSDHFRYFRIENTVTAHPNLASHVVNHAMAVKYPGLRSLFTGNPEDRSAVDTALAMLDRFHGQATGLFTGDEHLAGTNPSRGTELCAVVELMYSLETLVSLFGDTSYADRLESLVYNALPAAFDADMWVHQYDQQANQVLCSIDERPWTNGPDANIFGLEPNYRCCTGNFGQGWPKFVSHLWMSVPKGGLAAVSLGPSEVTTTIGGARVTITEKTDYPFDGEITFEIRTSEAATFPLLIRVPKWAEGAGISVDGDDPRPVKAGTFATVARTWKKKERVTLHLPLALRTSRGHNDSVRIHRGPLVFSLGIEAEWKRIRGEKPAPDYEVYPKSPWNYALGIDVSNPEKSIEVDTGKVKMPCFSENNAPVTLKAKARRLPEWGMDGASAAPPPQSPVQTGEPVEEVTLLPYGAAKLRVTEFPLAGE